MECSARLSWIKLSCSASRIPGKRKPRLQANDEPQPSTNWKFPQKKCESNLPASPVKLHQKKISISTFLLKTVVLPSHFKNPPKSSPKSKSEPLNQQVPPNPILRAPCSQRTPERPGFLVGKKRHVVFLTTKSIHVLPGIGVF